MNLVVQSAQADSQDVGSLPPIACYPGKNTAYYGFFHVLERLVQWKSGTSHSFTNLFATPATLHCASKQGIEWDFPDSLRRTGSIFIDISPVGDPCDAHNLAGIVDNIHDAVITHANPP